MAVQAIEPPIEFEKILVWRDDVEPSAPLRAFFTLWKEFRAAAKESSYAGT